jgi:AcrR family transcriptional regulator
VTDVAPAAVDDETLRFLLSQEMGAVAVADRVEPATPAQALEARLVEAMLDCIARWGLAKTTADDIARAAGVSRATLYRAFPGGKDVAFDALLRHETGRFFRTVSQSLESTTSVEDLVVTGIVGAARFLSGHEALAYVLAHEPERVLPAFTFDRLERTLAVATAFTAPHLRRFIGDDATVADRAEWLVRILLSYAMNPTPALDLTDEVGVRRFTTTYLLPALVPGTAAPTTASKER